MRVDKFLWCVRLFKTRSIATEACNKGQIKLNKSVTKASKEVFIGDVLGVRKNQINYTFEIIALPITRLGAKLVGLYIVDTTPAEELERMKIIQQSQEYYRSKGTGRPTKKDRRDLEDFADDYEI